MTYSSEILPLVCELKVVHLPTKWNVSNKTGRKKCAATGMVEITLNIFQRKSYSVWPQLTYRTT